MHFEKENEEEIEAWEKLVLLQGKLETHIEEYWKHIKEEKETIKKLVYLQQANSENIQELAKSTKGLVEAWEIADGVTKALTALGKFAKWLSGLSILGVILAWVIGQMGL